MERRRELLRREVSAIVKNMLDRGERPIRARVQKMLSANSLKAWKSRSEINPFRSLRDIM